MVAAKKIGRFRRIIFLAIAAGGLLWFVTMPYPISMWWRAQMNSCYSSAWPISWTDYAAARLALWSELEFREIIMHVTVVSPTEIHFTTLLYWRGNLASARSTYVAKKGVHGWEIERGMDFISSIDSPHTTG